MALTIELIQARKTNEGTYSIHLRVVRDDGSVVGGPKEYQVTSSAQFKATIKPVFIALVAEEQNKNQIASIAQGVIDEIMTEVIQ